MTAQTGEVDRGGIDTASACGDESDMTRHASLRSLRIPVALCALFALSGVDGCGESSTHTDPDGWVRSSPSAEGMRNSVLVRARDYAFVDGRNTQGVVVVRHGRIAAEWYAEDASVDSYAASWSMAKSFTSALVGIALAEGSIPSLDVPIATYVPSWQGGERDAITLRDVLEMSSGLAWDETYGGASDIGDMVFTEGSHLAIVAAKPLASTPGTTFNYSSGDTMLLSAVLQGATGMPVADYAELHLFAPLGLANVQWWRDATGQTLTYCCLDMRSRDFARFGELFLRGGMWNGASVVPSDWVAASLSPSPSFEGYGFQWWLLGRTDPELPADTFAAIGHDGQFIYVVPSLDLVVVRNGTYFKYDGEPVAVPYLFKRYPSDGLFDRLGTAPPDEWSDAAFLGPIIDSIVGE